MNGTNQNNLNKPRLRCFSFSNFKSATSIEFCQIPIVTCIFKLSLWAHCSSPSSVQLMLHEDSVSPQLYCEPLEGQNSSLSSWHPVGMDLLKAQRAIHQNSHCIPPISIREAWISSRKLSFFLITPQRFWGYNRVIKSRQHNKTRSDWHCIRERDFKR